VRLWRDLDADGPPVVVWPRPADGRRICLLLGAFDPLTNAHVHIVQAAALAEDSAPVLCLTKVLLARPPDELLPADVRAGLVCDVAERLSIGVAFSNRGTYLDVGRTLRADGFEPTFVVGADKLGQLADPAFYADGADGVRATFDELRFAVVPRGTHDPTPDRPADVRLLDPAEVFTDGVTGAISGTEVRRRHRSGAPVGDLVPPEVDLALRGYTAAR